MKTRHTFRAPRIASAAFDPPRVRHSRFLIGLVIPFVSLAVVLSACQPDLPPPEIPYPASEVITGVSFDWSTHERRAPGSDNWPLTWAADGHQYTSWGDGGGFGGTNARHRVSLGFGRIEGPAGDFLPVNTWGDPLNSESPAQFGGKTRAIIAIGTSLFFWRSPGSDVSGLDFQRLYRSDDGARSWTDTGVEWSYPDGIGLFAMIQFGQNHQDALDQYVYIYASELQEYRWEVQIPGRIVLLRVLATDLHDRTSYEFFAGVGSDGEPTWGGLRDRVAVFEDPNGLMRSSAAYNRCLDRYFLVTNHTARNEGNVAIFEAPRPWGPWRTVMYESGWPTGREVDPTTFFANFSPKWSWRPSGADFVLVFTGTGENDSWNSVVGKFEISSSAHDRCDEQAN